MLREKYIGHSNNRFFDNHMIVVSSNSSPKLQTISSNVEDYCMGTILRKHIFFLGSTIVK
jgi:hypothetical protein